MLPVQALTKFLKSVNWKVPQEAKQALDLLSRWSPMDVDDALELLSPVFVNPAVRKYAVTRLQQADDEVSVVLFTVMVCLVLSHSDTSTQHKTCIDPCGLRGCKN